MSGKKQILLIILILSVAAACILYLVLNKRIGKGNGQVKDPEPVSITSNTGEKPVMLIDFCYRVVGTVGGNRYEETVLYQNADGTCEVHYFSGQDDDPGKEHSAYKAPGSIVKEAYDIINENKIAGWNDCDYSVGPDGVDYSLKFLGSDGEYIRVSSGHMPEDGIRIMERVASCIGSCISGENAVEIP